MFSGRKLKLFLYDIYYFNIFRRYNAHLRAMPSLLIIGAQKAGTTSLFNYLISHSKIIRPLKKEIHYLSYYYNKSFLWYKMHFPIITDDSLTLDASTSYIIYPHTAKRASLLIPNAKIIALLRNPIERAYSHYYHTIKIGKENNSFEKALELESKRDEFILNNFRMDDDFAYNDMYRHSYCLRGIYVIQLKSWFRFFSKENILILESRSFFNKPHETINKIADFLKITNDFNFKALTYNKGVSKPPMSKETYIYLKNLFDPYNKYLFELIGEQFDW